MSVWDVLAFAGVSAVLVGTAAIYWPAAVILGGLMLVSVGVGGAKGEAQEKQK